MSYRMNDLLKQAAQFRDSSSMNALSSLAWASPTDAIDPKFVVAALRAVYFPAALTKYQRHDCNDLRLWVERSIGKEEIRRNLHYVMVDRDAEPDHYNVVAVDGKTLSRWRMPKAVANDTFVAWLEDPITALDRNGKVEPNPFRADGELTPPNWKRLDFMDPSKDWSGRLLPMFHLRFPSDIEDFAPMCDRRLKVKIRHPETGQEQWFQHAYLFRLCYQGESLKIYMPKDKRAPLYVQPTAHEDLSGLVMPMMD